MDGYWYRKVGGIIYQLRHVYLFLEEIMSSLCVLNELLILLFSSSSPCRKDQFAVSYFFTS